MENEELKKGSVVTEFDGLNDEQLEAVPGGGLIGGVDDEINASSVSDGKKYDTTVVAGSPLIIE